MSRQGVELLQQRQVTRADQSIWAVDMGSSTAVTIITAARTAENLVRRNPSPCFLLRDCARRNAVSIYWSPSFF